MTRSIIASSRRRTSSSSEMNSKENRQESAGIDLAAVANTSKADVVNNSLSEVKREIAADIDASSIQTDVCTEPQGSVDKDNNFFSSLGNEVSAAHPDPNSNLIFPTVNVKKEMVNIRSEGDNIAENVKLSLTSNELFNSPLENQKVDLNSQVTDKLDPPLLSLSFGKELPENKGADITLTDSSVIMSSTDRLNWDLNTTMDAWAGSIDDAASHDTLDVKNFLGSSSLVDVRVDKGKQVMEPFEERSTLGISCTSFQHFDAEDSLRLSLSTSSPHLILQRPIINSISSGSKIVKSEPVDENMKPDFLSVPCGTMRSLDNRLVNKKNTDTCEVPKIVDNMRNLIEPTSFKSSGIMTFSLQLSDKGNIDPNTITEGSAIDKEKISAMVEGENYVCDKEFDDNHDVVSQMGRDDGQCEKVDDDFEDGEVRELSRKSFAEDPTFERMLSENKKEVDDGCEMGAPTDKSTINDKHCDIKIIDESNDHDERIEALNDVNSNHLISDYVSLPEHVISVPTETKVPENSLVNLSVHDEFPEMKNMVQATANVARNDNVKAEVNEHRSLKDSALGGNRSRIINLPRASNSPLRMKSLSGRSFTSWNGRERYGDVDEDNLHYRGHRDDTYGGDSRKFSRGGSFRNSRMDFKRDRGRGTLPNKWDIGHFPSKSFDVSGDNRFNRYKRSNDFVSQDETGPSVGRLGRKPSIEEFHSFHQPSQRRLSPGYRDSLPNLCRIPDSDSDLPGHRNKKFFGGFPDDISGSYDEMDGQFVHRNQNYSRVFPRARSKSPVNTRTRSPGSWTSSRRRFNDDFNNSSDQNQHRPHKYRVERMRSPDRVCYNDELNDRRRASPNYVTRGNEMRDMYFSRGNGHIRSISSNRRRPSDSDEYFCAPIHPGRFHEFRGDGSNERRKFGERRDSFRPSRPPRVGGNENYHFNVENGSRPLRFCSDHDTKGQRDFDLAQRKIRSTEDDEGSFRQTENVWHDESFSDDSRMKRRRS